MKHTNDGGPAFPVSEEARLRNLQGLSLRDYFAAKALQGFCAGLEANDNIEALPELCFMLADEMIKARGKS